MSDAPRLQRRPEARAFSVETLLQDALDGRLRIPEFQRPQRWRTSHVLDLFDSVVRGFPVGEFLFSKQRAPASALKFGPLTIDAPEVGDALYLVDGQQRMTALAGALLHPDARPRGDIHAIWYDLVEQRFERLTRSEAPLHWVPLNVVGDSFKLLGWLNLWPLQRERPDFAKRAIALGKALREYQVPAYIVEGADEDTLRVIFKRANTAGVAMLEAEVFEALHGKDGRTLKAACSRLTELGFGPLPEDLFLLALKTVHGVDPRRRFRDDERSITIPPDAIERTERALRVVIGFLVGVAGIPHIDLLPYRLPLRILARFFDVHPSSDARTESLLTRWIWRGALSGVHAEASDAMVGALEDCIGDQPHAAAVALLQHSARALDEPSVLEPWNGRFANTKLCALALLSLGPRDPDTGATFTVDALQDRLGQGHELGEVFLAAGDGEQIVGRFLVADRNRLDRLLGAGLFTPDAEVLASHGLDAEAVALFAAGDGAGFERRRATLLEPRMRRFFRERAAPDESDRPSIAAIVAQADLAVSR